MNEAQEGEMRNIQRDKKRISPQRSMRGSPHHRRSPSGQGKGLDHDTYGIIMMSFFVYHDIVHLLL